MIATLPPVPHTDFVFPVAVWLGLLAAGLLQMVCYFSLALPKRRAWWTPLRLVPLMLLPWLLYTVPAGLFQWRALLTLLALFALAAFWFRLIPRGWWADLGFVLFMAAPVLLHLFELLYPSPAPKLPLGTLAHVAWIQIGLATILNERRIDPGFGFWPQAREWRIGLLWYLAVLPIVAVLALGLGFAHFELPATAIKYAAAFATFFGILWVVALSEEFFFRGLLQQWFEHWSGSAAVGLLLASLLFGAAHLGFREFPNWRFALTAAVSGVAYGMAYRKGGGIRAAMVTHALLVTTWRTFFR